MSCPLSRLRAVLAPLAVAACSHTEIGPGFVETLPTLDPARFTCCADPEKFYPEGFAKAVFSMADEWGPGVARKMYGRYNEEGFPGRLAGNREVEAALLAQLRPLDLVFTANKSYVWGTLIPGRFTHGEVYLGTEAQLRALGLWDTPGFAGLHDDIRAGRLFAESATPESKTIPAARVLESDAVAILRPHLSGAERGRALAALAGAMGTPYDYTFDLASPDKLACTELINLAMPGLRLGIQEAYGRQVIFPDRVVSQAIRGERMSLVGYMVGKAGGYQWRNTHSLMGDIAAYWGMPGSNR